MLKVASWNVNSLKVRLPHVLAWCDAAQPDILALQETKLTDDKFQEDGIAGALAEAGYRTLHSGQPTYNGVALLSREPGVDPVTDIPGLDDPQRRVLAATFGEVRVIDLYVVNGSEVGSEKFDYKLDWLSRVTDWVAKEMQRHENLVVVGDFNIAPDDRDVHDPETWHEKILCSSQERQALQRLLDLGLSDTFRRFEQQERSFSWWHYNPPWAFRANQGLRIDLILASESMAGRCKASYIDVEPRRQSRPSDHAPVVAEFD